jgi:sodium transport system permease protein
MSATLIVFLKECRESLRDRRVLLNSIVLGPLLGPLLFVILLRATIARELTQSEQPLPLVVIGAEYAPNLVSALEQTGLKVLPPVPDIEEAIRAQRIDVALRIPSSYAREWREGRPAQVELIYDSSRRESSAPLQRVRAALETYTRRTAAMRLMVRGLAPSLTAPLVVAARDQATSQGRGALLFAMLPYFLILSALLGGMWLAIDSTAGERERASLEPLLINPVPRDHILLGKVLATAAFSLASLTLGLLAFMAAGRLLPLERLGVSFNLAPQVIASILPLMVPLVLLINVAQILVTAFSRSVREAQTYLGLLQLVPVIPSVVLSLLPVKPQLWMYAVPLLSQQLSVMQLLRGEVLSLESVALSVLATLVCVVVVFALARRNYRSERLAVAPLV